MPTSNPALDEVRPAAAPASAEECPELYAGREWLIDASECDPALLKNLPIVLSLCDDVIADLGLRVVGAPLAHPFPGPGGVTAMYLLSESHLTCHTYPEFRLATFNLYCCANRQAWPWESELRRRLAAGAVSVHSIDRGRIEAGSAALTPPLRTVGSSGGAP